MPPMTTTVDPRSSTYADRRQAMLARLDELDEGLAIARIRVRARERVELLLDRDAPFLELYPVAGTGLVGGIGVVEGVDVVVAAQEPGALEGLDDRGKAYRLGSLAAEHGLPLIHLAEPEPGRTWRELRRAGTLVEVRFGPGGTPLGDYTVGVRATDADFTAEDERDAIRLARLCVGRLSGPRVAAPDPGRPPRYESDDLLGTADVREILARVLDDSELEEFQPDSEPLAGWARVHGYPVGVVAGEGATAKATRFAELVRAARIPLLRLHTVLDVTISLTSAPEHAPMTFAWPGARAADVVIDPRDTRTALGLVLAVIGRRA
jgi:acetyl-CoA carboxylase carboxyltransferase component